MSAIRNNSNRSEARKRRSTPYARGIMNTVSRFFNYLAGSPSDQSEEDDEIDQERSNARPIAQSPKYNFTPENRAPLTPSNVYNGRSSLPDPPIPNTEQVASYFTQRMGTNVTTNEVESMITNLQTTPERERFRFTFTTPGRMSSPSFSMPASPSAPDSKKLARNPNGVYRWEGGGSAKAARQRNRFSSPALGATPINPMPQEIPEYSTPSQDGKRRKVANDESISGQPSRSHANGGVPFPNMSPSTPPANGVSHQTSPLPSSRLRTPAKLTAPIHPSPLRQAWSDASSNSSHEDNKSSQASKPTKTASLVAELIKETAPPNRPDLSNPYQNASPVGKVGPPRRGTKRPRAVGRPPVPSKEQKAEEARKKAEEQKMKEEEEKLKALSAHAIIEATLPKGSKRSRPPAHIENEPTRDALHPPSATPHPSSIFTDTGDYIVEEAEDSGRVNKKSRSSSEETPQPKEIVADVIVEVIDDVDMDKEMTKESIEPAITADQLPRSVPSQNMKNSSVPKAPSKLRYSIQMESASSSPTPVSSSIPLPASPSEVQATPSPPVVEPTPPPPSIQAVSNGFNFSFKNPSTPPKEKSTELIVPEVPEISIDAVKIQISAMAIETLPTFVFSSIEFGAVSPMHVNAQEAAKAIGSSSLPSFSFASFSFDAINPKPACPVPVKESPTGFKLFPEVKPSMTPLPNNIFGNIPLKSTPSFFPKPPSVETPGNNQNLRNKDESKPNPATSTSSPPVKAFDWAAAGLKVPDASNDIWKCGTCGLSSPKSAKKCTVCDADAPGVTSSSSTSGIPSVSSTNMFAALVPKPASSSVKAFDFAAAGMKPPTLEKGTWTCSLCGLSNGPEASLKCTTCDTPKPQ